MVGISCAETGNVLRNPTLDKADKEYMAFSLGVEDYAVDILRVQEIRGWEVVTRIPNAPSYVKGVLNLRGTIVPIFDLRQRLGMPFRAYEKETVVIILRVVNGNVEKNIGVAVDSVAGVLSASVEGIQRAPDFGARLNTDFISGLVTANGKMVMLLDVDKLKHITSGDRTAESNAAGTNSESRQRETGAEGSENQPTDYR